MFVVVSRQDRRRAAVENLIAQLYWARYQAVPSFASTMVAEVTAGGGVEFAAGIRFGEEPFFSECYLDQPIEEVLQGRIGRKVRRDQMVEVCHLAGTKPGRSSPFVEKLAQLLREVKSEWAIFTAVKPLRNLLQRNCLKMLELAVADKSRVSNLRNWGNYFDHDPRIMAVSHCTGFAPKRFNLLQSRTTSPLDAQIF